MIARQQDCQTCFPCELYCPTDALYLGPDCKQPEPVDEQAITQTDWPQQYHAPAAPRAVAPPSRPHHWVYLPALFAVMYTQ